MTLTVPAAPTASGVTGAPGAATSGAPGASPMLSPQGKQAGMQAQGKVRVQVATHILTLALKDLGPMSQDSQAVLKAISTLTKQFGKSEDESKPLIPAEIQQALQPAAGPGAAPKPPMPPGAPPGAPAAAPPAPQGA